MSVKEYIGVHEPMLLEEEGRGRSSLPENCMCLKGFHYLIWRWKTVCPARRRPNIFWGERRKIESSVHSDTVWLMRGWGKRKLWEKSGGRHKEGRKTNWQRKRYKSCLTDVGLPWGASAVKQHADSFLVLSDENSTLPWTTPTSTSALHMQDQWKQIHCEFIMSRNSLWEKRGNDPGVLNVFSGQWDFCHNHVIG